MKKLVFCIYMLAISFGFAQKIDVSQSIINENVGIKKYHNKSELIRMDKGELLGLYMERVEDLVKTLPYIAFATKPGKTMATYGIPNSKENRKALLNKENATTDFLKTTIQFQEKMLPYSDKSNLVAAILFYEETMKSLQQYDELNH